MKTYTVYRFDYFRQVREPVGNLTECRGKERGDNAGSLLKLAQKIYSTSSLDSHIVISPNDGEVRRARQEAAQDAGVQPVEDGT